MHCTEQRPKAEGLRERVSIIFDYLASSIFDVQQTSQRNESFDNLHVGEGQ